MVAAGLTRLKEKTPKENKENNNSHGSRTAKQVPQQGLQEHQYKEIPQLRREEEDHGQSASRVGVTPQIRYICIRTKEK